MLSLYFIWKHWKTEKYWWIQTLPNCLFPMNLNTNWISLIQSASYFPENQLYAEIVHTLRKPWWIVVDISECDIYSCWPWQPSDLPSHIFGLNDNGIMLSGFPVHVVQGSPDDSCGGKKTNGRSGLACFRQRKS